jgi:hypothetical protein
MPQINSGKSPPWVAGEIVTAAGLNGMIDSATIDPSAITAQSNLATLTGDEYALIVDTTGVLKKTQLKNSLLTGNNIEVDNILGKSNNGILLVRSTGSASTLRLEADVGGLGTIIASCTNLNLNATNAFANNGSVAIASGTSGMFLTSQGGLDFTATYPRFISTSAVKLPVGTTAQRPASPVAGDTRFNSTLAKQEIYDGANWSSISIKAAVLTRELTNGSQFTYIGYTWTDIPYNTINQTEPFVVNSASFTGVLSSTGTGIITLPAGTYTIEAEASIQSAGGSAPVTTRVYNGTSFSEIKVGTTAVCGGFGNSTSIVYAIFTLSTQSDISVQYYMDYPTSGIASSLSGGTPTSAEVVFTSKITKLS